MSSENIQWKLIARPEGEAKLSDFEITSSPIPEPGPDEVLVKNLYMLVPPSMRLWMNEKESYFPPAALGEVMLGITLGVVTQSNSPDLPVGTYVNGMGGWQQWSVAPAAALQPLAPNPDIPIELYRSVLDVQGLTAYCGITDICDPQPGKTLVVSAAAGSVGSLACQIAKSRGAKVIGIAGGADKCAWLVDECGIDAAIDYKSEDVGERLDALAPEGIDAIFENVGGEIMDACLDRINDGAQIALCGLISSYLEDSTQRTSAIMALVNRAARMQGFLVSNYAHLAEPMLEELVPLVLSGKLKYKLEILEGLDSTLEALSRIQSGKNQGVQLIRIGTQ
ncbi:MAG: NADP-dependent oxidoreductase [Halioglobus sp.]